MFDYKNNISKKKKSQLLFNNVNEDWHYNEHNKYDIDNSKIEQIDDYKIEKNYSYKKLNVNKALVRNNEINPSFINNHSYNVNSKIFSNNNIYVKMNQNFNINFNLNSPNKINNINNNYNFGGRNKKYKQIKNSKNYDAKYQSYTNINEINKKFQNDIEYNINGYSIDNKQINKNNIIERNNYNFNLPTESNIYLNTENNINSRNISTKKLNMMHNKNYNLMNIDYSSQRNNTYSNINKKNFLYENSSKIMNSHHNKNRGNSYQCKNIKYCFKTKDSYICNDIKIDKVSLKNYYDHEFSEITNKDEQIYLNKEKNEYKFNNEDISYKDCPSTNYSTCNNEINKINNSKKVIQIQNRYNNNINLKNKYPENVEMFHFFMVSYLQKGKKLGNKFN